MKKSIGLFMMMSLVCSAVYAESITFQNYLNSYLGEADGGARQEAGKQYSNYGASDSVSAGIEDAADQTLVSFFRFDDMFGNGSNQLALNKTITGATLKIYVDGLQNSGTIRQVNAYAMLLPVVMGNKNANTASEGEVCWAQRARDVNDWGGGTQNGPVAGIDYTTSGAASVNISAVGFAEWDITEVLQEWYLSAQTQSESGMDNYGILLRYTGSSTGTRTNFVTTEGGTLLGAAEYRPALEITYANVPEPMTISLLLIGGGMAILRRKSA